MPRSSVFLRLQWPSTSSSESSHEVASSPQSSSTSTDKTCPCAPSSSLTATNSSLCDVMRNPCSSDTRNSVCAACSSPIVKWVDIDPALDGDGCSGTQSTNPELNAMGLNGNEEEMSSKVKNVKLRQMSEGAKAKRIARSLSASSATVSTNTDPEDFLYVRLASKPTSTLPKNFKDKGSRIIIPRVPMQSPAAEASPVQNSTAIDMDYIPYIDVECLQQGKNNSVNSLKVKRSSKDDMFCLPKYRFHSKPFSIFARKDPGLVKMECSSHVEGGASSSSSSRFSPLPEEIEDEVAIPDILSDCKIHSSYLTNNHSPQSSREGSPISGKSTASPLSESYQAELPEEFQDYSAIKKCVKFLLPPEYCDSFLSEADESFSGEYPPSGYAELDGSLMPPNGQDPYRNTPSPGLHGVPNDRYGNNDIRWRDPDLHEVIDFLSNPNNVVKANAAAYLQHLCYMDDATKQKSRILGCIPPLVALLSHELPELHRNACGALRNLSYGRQNDENKQSIKEAGGLPALVRLLRKTLDNEVKELVTGILWNLSSCEELKQSILDDALAVLVNHVIIPCSGWDGGEVERDPNNDVWWSTVFKNASGVIRNISSAGEYARTKLRHCHGLVDSLFCVIKLAINGNSHDNKSVENCVCILRNLSYRCQEVEDPNYDKHQLPVQSRATASGKGDNLGCFGGSRKKKEMVGGTLKDSTTVGGSRSSGQRGQPVRGMELLWQPDLVVQPYLALLSDCSNPETLEAAAGAIQNLAACYWQPSIDVRAAVRKEKGLPILVELLRMEVDRVVCAVATALRNLAIDQRNKELIGKYAMRDLVQKLPSQNSHDTVTSDETIAAVLATLNEVIKKNAEFSRSLLDAGGIDRLVYITRQRGRYSTRVVKFASQVLFSMWGHQELREVYKKAGWKEQDFVSKSVAARNASGGANSPTANNTLNRPMASQGGTRYEDRTIQRSNNQHKHHQQQQYSRREEVPLADLGYGGGELGAPGGGVRLYTTSMQGTPGEPVYAKVNRDKKRNRHYETEGIYGITAGGGEDWGEPPPAYTSSLPPSHPPSNYSEPNQATNTSMADMANNNEVGHLSTGEPAGDSWV